MPATTVHSLKAFEVTPDLVLAAARLATPLNAASAIHESDYILSYIIQHSSRSVERGPEGGLEEYFEGGRKDALQVEALVSKLGLSTTSRILEFAAGFGRVTRHLTHYQLTASDIHSEAVRFLADDIRVKAVPSAVDPGDFNPTDRFDFIFVLSLFSHLPDLLFGRWLSRLAQILTPGGYLMFTTHGDAAGQKVPALRDALDNEFGFGFLPYSDQADLSSEIYGSSIATPRYVADSVSRNTNAQIISFSAKSWWDLQDEWVIRSVE